MKIVLASALFPPDIAAPAPYCKELTRRLAATHQMTAVVYGQLPEEVAGAHIIAVSKRRALPLRLVAFTQALGRAARGADVLIVENGPSVELPALIVSLLCRATLVLHLGDRAALANRSFFTRLIKRRATRVITESPPERPEILPFFPRPDAALSAWERSWDGHVGMLEDIFVHAK